MKGTGTQNQFKQSSLLGMKVPVNVPYTFPLSIYNPLDVLLQIQEVFVVGGFLQLILPPSSDEGPVWVCIRQVGLCIEFEPGNSTVELERDSAGQVYE